MPPSQRSVNVFPLVELFEPDPPGVEPIDALVVRECWVEGMRLVMPEWPDHGLAFTAGQAAGPSAVILTIAPMVYIHKVPTWVHAHATPALDPAYADGPRWIELFYSDDQFVGDAVRTGDKLPAPHYGARIGDRWLWASDAGVEVIDGHRDGSTIDGAAVVATVRLLAREVHIRHRTADEVAAAAEARKARTARKSDETARPPGTCGRPPAGWYCSRDDGHDGPCPTWPAESGGSLDDQAATAEPEQSSSEPPSIV